MKLLWKIILAPRPVMRSIIEERGTRGVLAIVIAAFFSSSIKDFTFAKAAQAAQSLGGAKAIFIACFATAFGAVFSIGLYYLLSWLALVTGRFLGGVGDIKAVRAAIAWGMAPIVLALAYRIPAIFLWPDAIEARNHTAGRMADFDFSMPFGNAALYQVAILGILELLVFVGYLIVASQTLAEAHEISSLAGFGNLLMTFALPVVIGVAIGIAAYLSFH